jgi:hypothetical protein
MKWSELKRKAIKRGWYLIRNGKEHDIYPTLKRTMKFKFHGTVQKKLKQAFITN